MSRRHSRNGEDNSLGIVAEPYWGREQTKVKHEMLRRYLAPAARIIGTFADCFVYVDCCSGPWNTATEDLSDTSFSIAVKELREARDYLVTRNRNVKFRCLFIEKEAEPFARLAEFCNSVNDLSVTALQADFTDNLDYILRFVGARRNTFTFFFIDPTGWSPLALGKIGRLLKHKPSEVLINFMTSHIKRFIESSDLGTAFGPEYMQKVMGLNGQERDDLSAYSFADEIRKSYPFTCTSVVLNPLRDQTHFHLIYGTHNLRGVAKFKEAEKACFGIMQAVRIDAKHRQEVLGGQQELFDATPEHDRYVQQLRIHYLQQAGDALREARSQHGTISNEEAWKISSKYPLVWKSDLCNLLRS